MSVCLVCTVVVPTKAASRGGRGREGQAAWGAEGKPWYRSQWLGGHGWNVALPRYAIHVYMYFPSLGTKNACTTMHLSLRYRMAVSKSLRSGSTLIDFCCRLSWTFPLEKLFSKHSRAAPGQDEATSRADTDSASHSPAPADPGTVAELRKQIEELTSQNSELVLKVQVRSGRAQMHKCARNAWTQSHLLTHINRKNYSFK